MHIALLPLKHTSSIPPLSCPLCQIFCLQCSLCCLSFTFCIKKTSSLGDLANVEAFHLQNSIERYKYREHIYIRVKSRRLSRMQMAILGREWGASSHEYMRRGGFLWKVELILSIRYPWKHLDGNLVSNCLKILMDCCCWHSSPPRLKLIV